MKDKLYIQLRKHYDDALAIEPTHFNNPYATRFYKFIGQYIKHSPLRIVIPVSLLVTIFLYGLFGFLVIRLVSLFQHGF